MSGQMKYSSKKIFLLCLLILLLPFSATAQEQAEKNPLAPFEKLIGGKWVFEGGYQTVAWGLGKLSVKAKSYFVVDGAPQLVSEGQWFWHPGQQQIRGYFTAVQMPVVFFDYVTRFEDNKMISELKSYSAAGKEQRFLEVWDFTGDNRYEWSLLQKTENGNQTVMRNVFERKSK